MGVKDADGHKLHFHPRRVGKWLNGQQVGPLHVEIGPTNRCNHKCTFCTLDWITHGAVSLDRTVLLNALTEMAEAGVLSVYFAGEGEPTLHKNITEFVEKAYSLKMGVAMSTNGALYKGDMMERTLRCLSWLRFSVDAGTKETYSKIHGVRKEQFDLVLNNIKATVEFKKAKNLPVDIGVQAILMPENMDEMVSLTKICKTMGVDNIQIKPCHNHPKSSHTPQSYDMIQEGLANKLKSLEDENFTVVVRSKSMERLTEPRTYKRCHGFDFYSLVDANGDIVPCNIWYGKQDYIFGNLYKNSFKEIWFGKERQQIIQKIQDTCFKYCGNYRCRPDVLNRYLERVKNPHKNDEFI